MANFSLIASMRITISIDDDLLAVAKSLARDTNQTVDRILSDLARRGLHSVSSPLRNEASSFPTFNVPANALPITLEDVKGLE